MRRCWCSSETRTSLTRRTEFLEWDVQVSEGSSQQRPHDGQRRSQLAGGVRHEASLGLEGRFQAGEPHVWSASTHVHGCWRCAATWCALLRRSPYRRHIQNRIRASRNCRISATSGRSAAAIQISCAWSRTRRRRAERRLWRGPRSAPPTGLALRLSRDVEQLRPAPPVVPRPVHG